MKIVMFWVSFNVYIQKQQSEAKLYQKPEKKQLLWLDVKFCSKFSGNYGKLGN